MDSASLKAKASRVNFHFNSNKYLCVNHQLQPYPGLVTSWPHDPEQWPHDPEQCEPLWAPGASHDSRGPPFIISLSPQCLTKRALSSSPFLVAYSLSQGWLFWDPMDYSPPASSVHRISQVRNTVVGRYFLLQGIFPNKGLNPHLLHWQAGSLPLSHLGSPYFRLQGAKQGQRVFVSCLRLQS